MNPPLIMNPSESIRSSSTTICLTRKKGSRTFLTDVREKEKPWKRQYLSLPWFLLYLKTSAPDKLSKDRISAILKLLTYNSGLKNNDIVYQPFVEIDKDRLALAPHLILASRPERNLISLIHKLRDKSYFDLTKG